MRPINLTLPFLLILLALGLISCEEEPPIRPNPEELITTFVYILTPENGGNNVVLSYEDLDGEGGNPASYLVEPVPANTTFTGVILALDKTQSPIIEINQEIVHEDMYHQIFFNPDGVSLSITYDDMDEMGNPLGLATKVTSGDAGTGTLKVTLRHEPEKGASGVASGDITNANGSNDVEACFPITIQ